MSLCKIQSMKIRRYYEKKIITICDNCGKVILKSEDLIRIDKYGLRKFFIGGMYTRVSMDFCSNNCAINKLKEKSWEKE